MYFSAAGAFSHLMPEITTVRVMCQVCSAFLCKSYCIQPSRQISTSLHLSVVFDLCFESEQMISSIFSCSKKSYLFDLVGKNMGSTTESHLLCQLFFRAAIFPWECISAAWITVRSVRAVSYLDMKVGEMEQGVWKGEKRERGCERQGSPGNNNTWNSPGGLLNLAHHHFMTMYCAFLSCCTSRYIFCLRDWLSKLDFYCVCVSQPLLLHALQFY